MDYNFFFIAIEMEGERIGKRKSRSDFLKCVRIKGK